MSNLKFFFDTLLFSPWAILATWLNLEAPKKNFMKNKMNKRKMK
jgi:hypothetical protein